MPLEPLLVPFGYRLKEQYRKGLVGHWKMNVGGLIIPDLSNNGNYGKRTNYNWTSASGWAGQGDILDGDNDYVDAGNVTGANFGLGDFTISAWVKRVAGGDSYHTIVEKGYANSGFDFAYGGAGYTYLFLHTTTYTLSAILPTLNTWENFVVVADRDGNASLYVNGKWRVNKDISGQSGLNITNTKSLFIGGFNPGTADSMYGSLDDVRIYNRALSADEIAYSYFQQEDEWDLGLDDDIPAMQGIPIGLFQQGQVIG